MARTIVSSQLVANPALTTAQQTAMGTGQAVLSNQLLQVVTQDPTQYTDTYDLATLQNQLAAIQADLAAYTAARRAEIAYVNDLINLFSTATGAAT